MIKLAIVMFTITQIIMIFRIRKNYDRVEALRDELAVKGVLESPENNE